jgi:hypothetical protein
VTRVGEEEEADDITRERGLDEADCKYQQAMRAIHM